MNLAHRFDSIISRARKPAQLDTSRWPAETRMVDTSSGQLRVLDSGGTAPALVMAPDGPCVIEHYLPLISRLREHFRVVCFDLPGFGFSYARPDYRHGLRQGAEVILAVMDALEIRRATLAFSCVNGFYAIAAAKLAPERIDRLVLTQTPGMQAMRNWTSRIVPRSIRTPVIGQILNQAMRRKIAHGWYNVAVGDRALRPQLQGIADQALRHGACWSFAGVAQGMTAHAPEHGLLDGIEVPATLVWGTQDRSHRPTDPESIHCHIPAAQILRVPTGHFADLETPDVYSQLLIGQH